VVFISNVDSAIRIRVLPSLHCPELLIHGKRSLLHREKIPDDYFARFSNGMKLSDDIDLSNEYPNDDSRVSDKVNLYDASCSAVPQRNRLN